LGINLQKVN